MSMAVLVEKINIKNITDYVNTVNTDLETQVIRHKHNLGIDISLLENFVADHTEVQNAIMAAKGSAEINHTIYTDSANFLDSKYVEMLCALFKHIVYLKSDNFSDRFIVGNCSELALEVYNRLEKSKKINYYVRLFEDHKKYETRKKQYGIYKISSCNKITDRDNFIDECMSKIKTNPYITLNICGFTLKEIEEDPKIINLISYFSVVYILFCGEYSIGCYIFRDEVF